MDKKMKKVYLQPSLEVFKMVAECPLMASGSGPGDIINDDDDTPGGNGGSGTGDIINDDNANSRLIIGGGYSRSLW